MYYLWEKLGPGNPTLCPLKRAQVTLDFAYNSLILISQSLDVASDQEAPDAGLVWRIRGKKTLITPKVGGFLEDSPGELIPGTLRGDLAAGKG